MLRMMLAALPSKSIARCFNAHAAILAIFCFGDNPSAQPLSTTRSIILEVGKDMADQVQQAVDRLNRALIESGERDRYSIQHLYLLD